MSGVIFGGGSAALAPPQMAVSASTIINPDLRIIASLRQ
jgi:hypothetical protein